MLASHVMTHKPIPTHPHQPEAVCSLTMWRKLRGSQAQLSFAPGSCQKGVHNTESSDGRCESTHRGNVGL